MTWTSLWLLTQVSCQNYCACCKMLPVASLAYVKWALLHQMNHITATTKEVKLAFLDKVRNWSFVSMVLNLSLHTGLDWDFTCKRAHSGHAGEEQSHASDTCPNPISNARGHDAESEHSVARKRIATWNDELESLSRSGGKPSTQTTSSFLVVSRYEDRSSNLSCKHVLMRLKYLQVSFGWLGSQLQIYTEHTGHWTA